MTPKVLTVSEVSSSPTSDKRGMLGEVANVYDTTNGWRTYRYVQFDNGTGNLTSAANQVCYYVAASIGSYLMTTDVSDSDVNLVAGVLPAVFADQYYGWIQIGGKATVKTNGDDDIVAYDKLIGVGDGTCNSVAQDTAPTNTVLGTALADDDNAADTVSAYLELPFMV